MQEQVKMNADENQIVVYQPNETVRLDVRLENEAVGELSREATSKDFLVVRKEGCGNRKV